ncbi:amino acid adenylation domain-containing protein [Streptomyces sp. Je 1-4]|uniref:non-ribosomal peptide synthetase n=1 Tax=Streptomyces TaxID=1883 RepID=UPI0021DB0B0B|nr:MULTISPECIES: amino acid adenylation domain-containing protein [unclassified Streptomyces]UYB38229.1 amino acid adenylation domain-containing protein [Streptomyces sp. Je 1-4]UZQ34175.1 amino acid adenylation domain-containing protein [Streptomyces sp. Je 1-4] [Streptomyces sp. Je 1-4 4N24]UZQ41593.1 amino acid adenylation domain-containing protein [Streptomyces sp. Je 1-4] [Streptomyces sp. Je 1-4 4N24_ara]
MLPLSSSQEIVWLHEQVQPGSRAYNFTAALDLWGTLDTEALRHGLAATLDRHAGLRLELVALADAVPGQRVAEACAPRLRTVDLSGAADPEAAFQELLRTEAETPLDTYEAPLLRWTLVRLADDRHRLIHVEHHLIHDGHSFAILLRDVFTVYRGRVLGEPVELPPAPSYADHVRARSGDQATAERREGLEFWAGALREMSYDMPLPGLARPGARRRHHGGQLRQSIGADLAERLRAHARTRGLTPFATLLGLFAELLRRHSGRSQMVIGTAVGNRPRGFEETVGMFVNTIPLPLRLDPAAPAEDSMDEVTDTLIRALPHQEVPIQELTRALGLHTSGADNPLFGVMFSAHDAELPDIDVPGLDITLFEGFNTGTTRFDLDVVLLPDDRRGVGPRHGAAGMTLVWDYDADLFGEDVAKLLAGRFLDLLRAYLDAPGTALADLAPPPAPPALPAAAPEAPRHDPLDPATAHDRSLPALLVGARRITYGDLADRVAALAQRMLAAGVTAGQPVAAVLPRGADSVVTLLACLRTRAVYCPLSPSDPPARLTLLMERLNPALVLTSADATVSVPDGLPSATVDAEVLPPARAAEAVPGAAYLIHTSGSTGIPKPVAVGRAALENHLTGAAGRFGLRPGDRVLLFAQPSFDVALEEVLPSLYAGACLVAPEREVPTGTELAELLTAARVTVANLPTSYFLATRQEMRPALRDGHWTPRLLVLGGERLPADALRAFLADTDSTVLNVYGVTEAAISSTVHEITRDGLTDGAEIPLGTELPGERVHVLDAHHRPLPDGAVGELAIAGAGLAEGYAGNPEATEARFRRIEALGGERVYLTGDRGYRGRDGLLYFLGRLDHQVKLRGYRIELEEVEAAASAALGGRSCAVVLDREAPGGPRLVGFLESADEDGPWDEQALHTELSRRLPSALVPGRWARLDVMPRLAGGKPNRTALTRRAAALEPAAPAAPAAEPGDGQPAEPADPMTALLVEGWREALGHGRFDLSSDFFRSGGHSLLAAQLASWLEPRLGQRPPLRLLFQNPVLTDQAAALAAVGTATPVPAASTTVTESR